MDYIATNQALWNSRVGHHYASDFYDVPGFLAGKSSLTEIDLPLLGDDLHGKRVAHLQCHFGIDTLSLARMGAELVGLDFSEEAIAHAKVLALQTGLPAQFIQADVHNAAAAIGAPADIVFTTYGVIGWLPDMKHWARVVADCLKPGGKLLLVEFHPLLWMYDNDFTRPTYSYFNAAPIVEAEEGSYANPEARINLDAITWNHSIGEVFGALREAGLEVFHLDEYNFSPFPIFKENAEVGPGRWGIKGYEGMLPLVYSLMAVKGS